MVEEGGRSLYRHSAEGSHGVYDRNRWASFEADNGLCNLQRSRNSENS